MKRFDTSSARQAMERIRDLANSTEPLEERVDAAVGIASGLPRRDLEIVRAEVWGDIYRAQAKRSANASYVERAATAIRLGFLLRVRHELSQKRWTGSFDEVSGIFAKVGVTPADIAAATNDVNRALAELDLWRRRPPEVTANKIRSAIRDAAQDLLGSMGEAEAYDLLPLLASRSAGPDHVLLSRWSLSEAPAEELKLRLYELLALVNLPYERASEAEDASWSEPTKFVEKAIRIFWPVFRSHSPKEPEPDFAAFLAEVFKATGADDASKKTIQTRVSEIRPDLPK